jgi:acid phosphatase type 7
MRPALAVAAILFALCGCGRSGDGEPPPAIAAKGPPVIAAAGDIASSGKGDEITARLVDAMNPTLVLTTGDNAYPSGSLRDFERYYDPTWGRHRAITRPTPGNHDYETPEADGYFGYFGGAAGPRGKGYHSFDVGQWHVVTLNSQIDHGQGSEQLEWLERDLAASDARCTLAYWHMPRFTRGKYGDTPDVAPFWDALYEAGAEVVLAGHDHNYQRYRPVDPRGRRDDERGIHQFVIGTGGGTRYPLRADPRRAAGTDTALGVLRLVLRPSSFDFAFVAEPGSRYRDRGSRVRCH